MSKGDAVQFPVPKNLSKLYCPFMSGPVQIGMKMGGTALQPVPQPVYDLMQVPCIKGQCRLWIPGPQAGAFEGTVAPADVQGCCSLEGKGLA